MNLHLFFTGLPAACYVVSALLFVYGAAVIVMTSALFVRTTRRKGLSVVDTKNKNNAIDDGVSVVIPFRNEEDNLNELLTSIDKQNYGGMIEVVLVNDRSTDGGADVIKKFIPRNKNLCIKVMDVDEKSSITTGTKISTDIISTSINTDTRLTSKQKALDLGVDFSSRNLILFTDADMILEPTWVESMVNSRLSTDADMVFGHTAIIGINNDNDVNTVNIDDCVNKGTNVNTIGLIDKLFILLESYQLEYLFSFAHAFSKLNLTGSCMGNNILITKEAYTACGGQRGVGYTIVEDRALLELVRKRGFKAVAAEPFKATARTYPSKSKKQFANQMLRWARGGLRPDGGLFFAGLLLLTQNIIFLLSMICALPPVLMLQSVVNFILTWAFLSISFHKNGSPISKILFPAHYIFMMAETAVFLPLMLFKSKIEWKDRKV